MILVGNVLEEIIAGHVFGAHDSTNQTEGCAVCLFSRVPSAFFLVCRLPFFSCAVCLFSRVPSAFFFVQSATFFWAVCHFFFGVSVTDN